MTAGVFLCSLVRDGLRCSVACDGVMMDAGSIRRNHVYPSDCTHFTYGDLKKVSSPSLPPITRFMHGAAIVRVVESARTEGCLRALQGYTTFIGYSTKADSLLWLQGLTQS